MGISSLQLEAFVSVAKYQSFSSAAHAMGLTQSALSQRVLNLESDLGVTLFNRDSAGIRLTVVGQKLLRYAQVKESLEQEFLNDLISQDRNQMKGLVRIGGASTLVRSVLIPILGGLGRAHPDIQFEVVNLELSEMAGQLSSGRIDIALTCEPIQKQGLKCILLGHEENVLIRSSRGKCREGVYLDHDEKDLTTIQFLETQAKVPKNFRREYFDDIYTILEAVKQGLGCAVVPRHILNSVSGIEVLEKFKPHKNGVYLCYFEQSYYTSLQNLIIQKISEAVPEYLQCD